MTIEAQTLPSQLRPTAWNRFCHSAIYRRCLDLLVEMTAASLPWSTTAPAIFIALWLVLVIPTIAWKAFGRELAQPANAWPLALFGLGVVGTLWSETAWPARLHGIDPLAKLLLIPFLLHHFQRSRRGMRIFIAFLASCTLLMLLSGIVLYDPALKIAATASDGVPVKNYIDQSQEFAVCAFGLALPALQRLRQRQWLAAFICLVLIADFLANLMFVVSARTALVYMPVLLLVFASLHLKRRAALLLIAAAGVAGLLVWITSPYLRTRVADIAVEYQAHDLIQPASTAQRLNYWRTSIKLWAEAPLIGHGTGSIRSLFEREAVGKTGVQAEVIGNPHNQTLNIAVQLGFVGVIMLYAMWVSHLLLFTGEGPVEWIGMAIIVQNVVSSLLNSHLSDFHEGWMYVLGIGVAGGMALRARRLRERSTSARRAQGNCGADRN